MHAFGCAFIFLMFYNFNRSFVWPISPEVIYEKEIQIYIVGQFASFWSINFGLLAFPTT